MTFTLEPASRRDSPQDGLITALYPKIAAMMALDSAAHLHTSTGDTEALRASAVREAAKKEECKLFWDHDSQRYYLLHPGLKSHNNHNDQNVEGQRFVIIPEPGVGFDLPGARGTIRLMDTTPQNNTLVSLEFGTATLLIDTSATIKIPSFYMVDIAISALIAVALVEGRKARHHHHHLLQTRRTMSPTLATTTIPPPLLQQKNPGKIEEQQQMTHEEDGGNGTTAAAAVAGGGEGIGENNNNNNNKSSSSTSVLSALFKTLRFISGLLATMIMGILGACFHRDDAHDDRHEMKK